MDRALSFLQIPCTQHPSASSNAFMGLPAKMVEIGGQIIEGLWQGIQARWEGVNTNVIITTNGWIDDL
ncbi:hypothetical protein [Rhizobium sp. CECT 9324]|uniref:hypothetical protein n=1 Tax=Rhizobium sp. CECT 9324 TaxID=2845820 RepID=UPI001E52C460|nr:hypothetical protein [Rhizobium sp. CECT 9324]